jgi:hypothetical protein
MECVWSGGFQTGVGLYYVLCSAEQQDLNKAIHVKVLTMVHKVQNDWVGGILSN